MMNVWQHHCAYWFDLKQCNELTSNLDIKIYFNCQFLTEKCFWWKVKLQAGDLPCAVRINHVLLSTGTVPWDHIPTSLTPPSWHMWKCPTGCHCGVSSTTFFWFTLSNFWRSGFFCVCEGGGVGSVPLPKLTFSFLSPAVALFSLINSQTGIAILAMCLLGALWHFSFSAEGGKKAA